MSAGPHNSSHGRSDQVIDFGDLAQALLQRADSLVPAWLPGGQVKGHEYVCSDLGGGDGASLSVNLKSGVWADFSGLRWSLA